jgi:hypothetical protein
MTSQKFMRLVPVPVAHSGDSVSRIGNGGESVSLIDPKAFRMHITHNWHASDADQNLHRDITAVIAQYQTLHQQAIEAHAPSVYEILRNGSRNAPLIERTLDQLLDHACIPQGLALFKALCRHYWEINSQATASYIHAYREMWDSDDKNETEVGHEH